MKAQVTALAQALENETLFADKRIIIFPCCWNPADDTLIPGVGATLPVTLDASGNVLEAGLTPTLVDPDGNHVSLDSAVFTASTGTGNSAALGPWAGHGTVAALIVSGIVDDTFGLYGGYTTDTDTFFEIPMLAVAADPAASDPYTVTQVDTVQLFGVVVGSTAGKLVLLPLPPYLALHRTSVTTDDAVTATVYLTAGS